jgi:hypothetical protein
VPSTRKTPKFILVAGYAAKSTKKTSMNPPCLDSGSTTTMCHSEDESLKDTYCLGSKDTVQLAAGTETAKCIGSGTFDYEHLLLPDAVHVQGLNGTLVSVGHICDQGRLVVFNAKTAVILDTNTFTADDDLVMTTVPINENGLCFLSVGQISVQNQQANLGKHPKRAKMLIFGTEDSSM